MTENPSTAGREAFQKSLLECVQDINEMLPGLSRRYDMTVIIAGLAEHVGAALQVLIRKNICDVRQAGRVIEQIEGSAFVRKGAQPRSQGSPGGTDAGAGGRGGATGDGHTHGEASPGAVTASRTPAPPGPAPGSPAADGPENSTRH